MSSGDSKKALVALREVLDRRAKIYKELAGVNDAGAYMIVGPDRDDEEILTEPIFEDVLEKVLGFPPDAYFPQLSKSGLKPDFTPMDLIAHPFVLDAKSSRQKLIDHEDQIRGYIDQRQLDFGILFNLTHFAVFRRGTKGSDPELSFSVEALWKLSRDEAQPGADFEAFERFLERFSYREVDEAAKIDAIRDAPSWDERGEDLRVDIDLLVEQLRRLSRLLADDVDGQPESLTRHIKLNPGFDKRVLAELAAIAQDIRPRTDEGSLPAKVTGYRSGSTFERRVWAQYSLRVSQLTLARIMLYRAWEDAGFIREQLYDGGFRDAYAAHGERVRDVLKAAFSTGAQRYHWLFERQTTYDWYTPREAALVEVLYSLTQFPLDRLDADVLGGLYESYVDEIDRDRLGQFYTPRDVVKFMLDRAKFSGADGVMRIEGDAREPVKTFDFASGSGGFDVEIARRVIDDSGALSGDSDLQLDALAAISQGVHAIEISPFPYYLTEINLLLQVSRLLGALSDAEEEVGGSFVLSVVHEDALKAKRPTVESFEGLDPEHRADHALLQEDQRFGLTASLDPDKQAAFTRIREGRFDLVVGNPPYVAEANNKPLFERLRQIDAWDGIYKGKSDYYYYFLYMAAELLAPGGRMCVIVPASWMNAGNADWLREQLAGTLRLDELFLFGSYRLFAPEAEARARVHRAPTPTVESAILVATKGKAPKGHKMRVVALEDEAAAALALSGDADVTAPDRRELLEEMTVRAGGRQGRKAGVHVHDLMQRELSSDSPWPIKHSKKDLAQKVVTHLDLGMTQGLNVPLAEMWTVIAGIETGADAFTPRIRQRLQRQFPRVLQDLPEGCDPGDPILQLGPGVEAIEPWRSNPQFLAHSPEARGIFYGAVDGDDYTNLVWLTAEDEPPKEVLKALEPWRALLEVRAGHLEATDKPWWASHRPRSKAQLRRPKVIGVHRTDRGRFAVDEKGAFQSGKSGAMIVYSSAREQGPIQLLCGYLNSELLDLWYGVRGRVARDIWRDYEPKPMARIPYRHVAVDDIGLFSERKNLSKKLRGNHVDEGLSVVGAIADALRDSGDEGLRLDAPEAIRAGQALEVLVEAIADNRRALLPFRKRFPALVRVIKDPWSAEIVDPDARAFVDALPKKKRASVRVDPELQVEVVTDGMLGRAQMEEAALVFRYRRHEVGRVTGPRERLVFLAELCAGLHRPTPDDLLGVELPRDIAVFKEEIVTTAAEVRELLDDGRQLVEAAERLVCALYAVPKELEDEVVSHAVARANATPDAG